MNVKIKIGTLASARLYSTSIDSGGGPPAKASFIEIDSGLDNGQTRSNNNEHPHGSAAGVLI